MRLITFLTDSVYALNCGSVTAYWLDRTMKTAECGCGPVTFCSIRSFAWTDSGLFVKLMSLLRTSASRAPVRPPITSNATTQVTIVLQGWRLLARASVSGEMRRAIGFLLLRGGLVTGALEVDRPRIVHLRRTLTA